MSIAMNKTSLSRIEWSRVIYLFPFLLRSQCEEKIAREKKNVHPKCWKQNTSILEFSRNNKNNNKMQLCRNILPILNRRIVSQVWKRKCWSECGRKRVETLSLSLVWLYHRKILQPCIHSTAPLRSVPHKQNRIRVVFHIIDNVAYEENVQKCIQIDASLCVANAHCSLVSLTHCGFCTSHGHSDSVTLVCVWKSGNQHTQYGSLFRVLFFAFHFLRHFCISHKQHSTLPLLLHWDDSTCSDSQ